MPKIVILGGIEDDHDRETLIRKLGERTGGGIEWDWAKAIAKDGFRPPTKIFNRLMADLQTKPRPDCKVVLLRRLNKDTKNRLLRVYPDPVLVETDWRTGDELVDWLVSPAAGLVPPTEWCAGVGEAAFFCVMAKLLRDKSWNKDRHGHQWTKEVHLLGDAPVDVPERPEVRREATALLERMESTLLLTKGGSQGKTPKEWSIKLCYLSAIKKAFLAQSLGPLNSVEALSGLLGYLRAVKEGNRLYRLDTVIQVERVRAICREPDRRKGSAGE